MDLNRIESPQDIKGLSLDELKDLSGKIRRRIIEVVSDKGGHLASSLGAVEIILALHYVLSAPEDKIVFDVGHQAYAHKLLTGRDKDFDKLRELGGISGFPYHKESVYDPFSVGHASNAVSLALGLSSAYRILGSRAKVVAVIGDGSLSGGESFEALNNAGHLKENILVVFSHNEMSISKSVGALSSYLNKFLSLPIYNRFKDGISLVLEKVPRLGKRIVPRLKKIEEIMKGIIIPGIFFEELGFRYFGPLDGHSLDVLIPTLKNILSLSGPKILHIVTQKGKGYSDAEKNPEKFHSASRFLYSHDQPEEKKPSYTDVFGRKIVDIANRDDRIVGLTAAMSGGTGLREFQKKFPSRFFDVGIAEQHLVSFSAGLCKAGLKPVIAVYSTFLQRAYDQVIEDIALQEMPVTFAVDRAGLVGEDGPTHHGIFDIAYLRTVPFAVVVAPGYGRDLELALEFAVGLGKPCFVRYPRSAVFDKEMKQPFALGKFEIFRKGETLALLGLGSMFQPACAIADKLGKEGKSVFLVNPRFVKPLDEACLLEIAEKTDLIITLEEGIKPGGFGESVLEFYHSRDLFNKVRVVNLGLPDSFITFGKRERLLEIYGLGEESIYLRIKQEIQKGYGRSKD